MEWSSLIVACRPEFELGFEMKRESTNHNVSSRQMMVVLVIPVAPRWKPHQDVPQNLVRL